MSKPHIDQHRIRSVGRRPVDRMGRTYGKWTVTEFADIGRSGAKWRVRCECGKERTVYGWRLDEGSKSCGCDTAEVDGLRLVEKRRVLDITDKRYGRLSALRMVHIDAKRGAAWLCQCDCGKKTTVYTAQLNRMQGTKSCGCLLTEARQRNIMHLTRK